MQPLLFFFIPACVRFASVALFLPVVLYTSSSTAGLTLPGRFLLYPEDDDDDDSVQAHARFPRSCRPELRLHPSKITKRALFSREAQRLFLGLMRGVHMEKWPGRNVSHDEY